MDDFLEIIKELERKPLDINKYRQTIGRSQVYGITNRRCIKPDYSRNCWVRPYLYKLLLDYGNKNVPFPFTSITVNQNYQAQPHKDKGNVGQSFLVGFGNYTGGELKIHEGELEGLHDIRTPVITDFSKVIHSVEDFTGDRYSLVYYNIRNKPDDIPLPDVKEEDKWYFYRGNEKITKKNPLFHPLQKKKH